MTTTKKVKRKKKTAIVELPPAPQAAEALDPAQELDLPPEGTPLEDFKREKFCHLIVDGHPQWYAAKMAGFGRYEDDGLVSNNRTLAVIGSSLLTNLDIQNRIREIQDWLCHRFNISHARVLREYAQLAFSDVGDVLDLESGSPYKIMRNLGDIPTHARRAIQSVEVKQTRYSNPDEGDNVEEFLYKIKLHPKVAALDALAKNLGILNPDGQPTTAAFAFVLPEKAPNAQVWAEQVKGLRDIARALGK